MSTETRYIDALNEMRVARSFKMKTILQRHHVSCTVGTVAARIRWVGRTGSRSWKWTGPSPISGDDMEKFMELIRAYKAETRRNAPSMQPGARQERRERLEKFQGKRTDKETSVGAPVKDILNTVTVNMPPRTVSILWGMIRFTL